MYIENSNCNYYTLASTSDKASCFSFSCAIILSSSSRAVFNLLHYYTGQCCTYKVNNDLSLFGSTVRNTFEYKSKALTHIHIDLHAYNINNITFHGGRL